MSSGFLYLTCAIRRADFGLPVLQSPTLKAMKMRRADQKGVKKEQEKDESRHRRSFPTLLSSAYAQGRKLPFCIRAQWNLIEYSTIFVAI